MNHIYKVVWSKVRNCYVAVSEIAKGHGKKSTSEKWGGKKAALLAAVIFTLGIGGTVGAAGPAAIENGTASKADGIASIAVGVGDKVVSSNTDENHYQGATSIAVGTLNTIDADADAPFDGAASSVVGQVNYTKNTNAAVIMGAGNKVTNSYREVKLDEKTLQELIQAYRKKDMKTVTEILQKAVPESGGQVMVMGGGNTVDYAQASQVMGVGNTLKGTKDSVSKYNLVDGFQNKVTNSQNTYVVGTKNNFVNMANSIVLGDNNNRIANNTDRIMKDTIVIGDGNTVQNGDESIAIGKNIHIKRDGGIGYEYDTGNVAIGSNAYISSYVNQGDSIAIGKNASVVNMNGSLEQAFAFGRTMGKDYSGSIAIGENAYARSGSTMIGVHDYQGKLGDMTIDFTKGKQEASSGIMDYSESIDATTIGNNSYNNGTFSTVLGSYSAVSGLYHNAQWGSKPYGVQNFGAAVVGSLNSVESLTSEDHNTAGMADSILGSANRTKNANGTVMVGAGNEVTNSINDFDASGIKVKGGIADPNTLSKAMRTAIQNQNGGGAAAVVGNGNIVDNATNVSILGSKNSLKNTKKAQLMGDNRVVDKADYSVIVGSADPELTTSNKNVTVLGYNANASVDGGVALGSGSIASTDKGAFGFDLKGEDHSSDTTGTWKSTAAAVSVGNKEKNLTRQITNVAAGTEDTDAVNVAQLKRVSNDAKTKYYSVNETYNGQVPVIAGYEAYTNADNKGAKKFASLASGYMTYADGFASTVSGSFSGITNEAPQSGSIDFRGAAALSYGTFNINDNTSASQPFSGVANSIVGQANVTTDSNAAMVYGAGNSVTNSYRAIDVQKAGAIMQGLKDPRQLNEALKAAVPTSGAQVMVMGGGNTVDKAYMTQVVGVGNRVTGSDKEYVEGTSTQLNYVDGFYNKVENGKNDYVIGSHNTLTGSSVDTNKSNLVLGDNHKLTDRKNNVILGSADDKDTVTNASDAVILGYNANASVDGGVAIGSGSVAETGAGIAGYDPLTKANSTSKDTAWTSSWAAVSVGDSTHTRQITGVAAGTALTDAVNVAQLKSVMNMPVNIYNGGKMASDSYTAGTKISNNWNLSNLQFDFGDGLKAQEVGDDGDKRVLVTLDKNALKGDSDFKGDKGDTGPQGPAGKDGKDGINGKDGAVGPQGPAGKDGINGKDGKDGKDGINGKDGKDGKDGGVGTVVGDDTNITAVNTETDATKPANYKVSLNKEITVAKVTAGDTTVSSDGVSIAGGPSMTTNGIDAAGKKITHVAAGTETTDAVNYGQLKDVESKVDGNSQAITNLNGHVNRLDNRINKVGAGAAALAGLHPLDFDPSDKWNFAVGYGNYRNANSVAVGAFYRPNEDTMVSVGTNFGNGENMVNAGVSFKLGQGSSYAGVSKAELAEENQKLKANDAAQDQKIQKQEQEIQELKKALEELKSHIK